MSAVAAPPVPVPAYGTASLADVGPSVGALLGVPGTTDVLGLADRTGPVGRVCVLLVDGLGADLLAAHPEQAPFLSSLSSPPDGRGVLTAGFPATTATSLGSIGTGLPPGAHGILGYLVAVPGSGVLMNALRWDPDVDPRRWQPHETLFERAAAAGIAVRHVGPGFHNGTGLTTAVFRGAEYRPAESPGEVAALAGHAARDSGRSLVYAYHGDLDRAGHVFGVDSDAWRFQLRHADLLAESLATALPPDAVLLVTADHGMVDVPPGSRVDVDRSPELRAGVALLGGEARARHVYAVPGAAGDVLDAWTAGLGDRMWVVSREQAVADGWFGPAVPPEMLPRIGDVVAAAFGDVAVVAGDAEPLESALVGLHGSMTPAEQRVPLLLARAGAAL
ncbi:MAG TPA: nucleotide pyrophosphatase/phosphodiesterase family protein [Mycobacteriales bacterium]